jgi:5'-3' exonuclease
MTATPAPIWIPQSIALVDLSCLFKKNFMVMPGEPEAASRQTLKELASVRESVEHVILCLDAPPYERRLAIFADYKALRPAPTDAEKAQKRWLYAQCTVAGYQMARVQGEEADDVIATLARIYGEMCPDVRLVGADKDLAQCVTENVRQMVPAIGARPSELRGPERILEKYGVKPDQIPMWLALVGDKGDNVPGVPGIGQVKAVRLISEHRTFYDLGQAAHLRPPSGDWKSLKENWSQFEMSMALVILNRNLPIDANALLIPLERKADDVALAADLPFPPASTTKSSPPPVGQPIIGKDPKADEVLRQLAAEHQRLCESITGIHPVDTRVHAHEQEKEEQWRRDMREENEAAERDYQVKRNPPANEVTGEFDPIGKSPGANGPLPPKPAAVVALPPPVLNSNLRGLARLRAPFEKHQVSKLPKGTKDQNNCQPSEKRSCQVCGGWHHPKIIHLDYVGHAAITDRLLEADPMWFWEPMAIAPNGLPLFDSSGGLWIRLTVCGVTRLGYGNAAGKNAQDPGSREKEVIGDALRNAAMRFGAALDLWHKGDDLHDEDWDATDAWQHVGGA